MIDPKKTYRTRDGREVRIYAVDGRPGLTVHGAIKRGDGWEVCGWRSDGRLGVYTTTDSDLVEVRPRIKREMWVNVYPHEETTWPCRTAADECASGDRIACVRVEIDVDAIYDGEELYLAGDRKSVV